MRDGSRYAQWQPPGDLPDGMPPVEVPPEPSEQPEPMAPELPPRPDEAPPPAPPESAAAAAQAA